MIWAEPERKGPVSVVTPVTCKASHRAAGKGSRAASLQGSEGCQILAHAASCGMEEAARLAVGPAARPVRSSTGVGQG